MSIGIACLLADDERVAMDAAAQLDRLNRERREIEATMQEQALEGIDEVAAGDAFTLCLYRREWHQGVVGIVASRLKDRFHRPVVVFAPSADGELRGSGRAIAGFHLRDALDLVAKRAPGTVVRFGGHAYAAGLSIPEHALPRFAEEFEGVAREQLSAAALRRTLETDGTLPGEDLTLSLADELQERIWGQGFPAPLFEGEFSLVEQRVVGGEHIRAVLSCAGRRLDAIAFRRPEQLPASFRAVYRPERNEFQGLSSLQLVLEHWEPLPEATPE
jgi:single-stranded-DNA-specific exonuclease